MKFLYLDSCAAIKLFKQEVETEALENWLAGQIPARQITSHLTRTELRRGLHAAGAQSDAFARAEHWLDRCAHFAVSASLFDKAGKIAPGTRLRSLDAIHVASAMEFGAALQHFVTYDKRLATAAEGQGLPVISPA